MSERVLAYSQSNKRPIYQKILVMFCVMTLVSASLTFLMTYLNKGFSDGFYYDWSTSYILALLVMAPIGFSAMYLFSKGINAAFPNSAELTKKLLTACLMALVMESVMSATTTANNIGFENSGVYLDAWLNGFLGSLPLGLVIAMCMTFFVKPRLDKFLKS